MSDEELERDAPADEGEEGEAARSPSYHPLGGAPAPLPYLLRAHLAARGGSALPG